MNILITGAAGFLGYSISESLLKKKHKIYGLDNLNDYYSVNYKKKRLNELKKFRNFIFIKADISNYKILDQIFKKKKIDLVLHFAAQAGVRYSVLQPQEYISSNISGFINILEICRKKKIRKVFYASSSSVYGENFNYPWKERYKIKPISLYAKTKKFNEEIANFYFEKYKIQVIGFRFFTIFGEWGRPDMFLFKLFKSILNKNILEINNYGKHLRDFTYINDVKKILISILNKKFARHQIYNICSNKPISLLQILDYFKEYNVKIKMIKRNKLDVMNTHGDNSKIKSLLPNISFSDKKTSILNTFNWYKKNKINIY